ncbi:CdiA family toxin C-terminal domain-containing protein [Treponema sp.]|uniref:CdiA family toxin C-terminal domain-containing protein n=1 Tax=Treponema sp. TaxID=166 RepID=UPI00298DFB68|nr:CdiA family toxin C-terminal domain-containing protein [Treponema sp.]
MPALKQNDTLDQGVYKKIKAHKTVYDSSIISDEQMLQWGKEAMQNGIDNGNIRDGRYISGTASNGLRFEGYIDSATNTITNFHPVLD